MEGNVKISGRVTPLYVAEWEYYDFYERKKVVERGWPKSSEEVQEFREQMKNIDWNNLNKTMAGSRILTGVRIYKGDEIIYDCYCPLRELSMLNTLSTKTVLFKK